MARNGVLIVPGRLTEAREIRGLTISELAEKVGKTRQLISAYESESVSPSPEVLNAISLVLDVPISFFRKPKEGETSVLDCTIFYRSMKSTQAKQRRQINRWLQWAFNRMEFYQQYVEFPEPQIPNFDIDYKNLINEEIEEMAEKTRRHWGLGDGPINNLTLLLENNGIIIANHDFEMEELDACSVVVKNRPLVFINSTKNSCSRYLANLAHELGHIVLHSGIDKTEIEDKKTLDVLENQAWIFASAFLMPAASFAEEVYRASLSSFIALKKRWRTSISAMIMRCHNLGIIDDYKKKSLFIEMSRRHMKKREPLDDEIEIEKPHMLFDADKLICEQILSKNEILELSTISPNDYWRLISADENYFAQVRNKPKLYALE